MHRFILLFLLSLNLPAGEILSTPEDQTGLSLTIYNQNLALIRDQRRVNLPGGVQDLALRGVSGKLQAETALLETGDENELHVLEQNFNYDLLTPEKLLEKYQGRQITILRTNPATGEETRQTATVLSTQEGLVVRIGDRIETDPGGRFLFEDIPENLRDQPTLVTRLRVERAGPRELLLSYLSTGLGWKADYVARLNRENERMELAGWVTLENHSGTAYHDARLQLVAGEVNRVSAEEPSERGYLKAMRMAAEQPLREETLFEYHLYSLDRPTTLLDRQTKQVALLSAGGIPAVREYLLEGSEYHYLRKMAGPQRKQPVAVWLGFDNGEETGLGMPLPAGVVRVYQEDSRGSLQFLGEDRIGHTPRNERVRLKLGTAFDITATRTQTGWRKQNYGHPYSWAARSSYRIELKNAKNQPVEVQVREPIPGDWQILHETAPHETLDARTAQWRIRVPARGSARLEYTVLVQK